MAQNALLRPGKEAGEFVIPALGRSVKLVEWREDDYFDSVTMAAGLVAAGTRLELFRDIQNKNLQHCNLPTSRRIASGSEMVLSRIGMLIAQSVGQTITVGDDINKVAYSANFTFKIGTSRVIAEGPLVKYQSGYGVTGCTTDGARSYVTFGVPSVAAAPQLLVAQPVKDDDDLYGTISFDNAAWILGFTMPTTVSQVVFTCFLHGLIKRPQGK